MTAPASCASLAKRTRWRTVLRITLKVLLWPMGAYLFVGATVFIVAFLMLAGGVWEHTLVMLFVPVAVIAIVAALSNRASERLDLHDIEIAVLGVVSITGFPLAFLLIGLYLVPVWAQPLAWSLGFLLGGAGWLVVIEQATHMDEPKQPPTRRQLLASETARRIAGRIAEWTRLNLLSGKIQGRADWLACRINERGRREKWVAFWIAIATVLALFLMVLSWTILGFSRQEELLEEWMAEIFAVWYSVLAAGTALATLALFWHAIWRRLLRGGVKLLLWLVGAYFFVSATTAIQDCLVLCGEGWDHVLAMVFVPVAAIAIAGTAAEVILGRCKPGRTQIMVFAAVSFLIWVVVFIPLGNLADGWRQLILAVGFLISGAGWMAAIEPRAQTEKRTWRLITPRGVVKLTPWFVGAFFFVLADTFIQGSLMLGSEGWYAVLIMSLAPAAAIAFAGASAEGVSGRFKLGAMKIMVLAVVSLLIWIAFAYFGNLADGWLQGLIWAGGFLISGGGWRAVGEQMVHMASPENTPRRRECPPSTKVFSMAGRIAKRRGLSWLSGMIQSVARKLSDRINERKKREKWAAFWIAIATMTLLWLVATLLAALRLIASEEPLTKWLEEWLWALFLSVAAAGITLATLALFWCGIRRRRRGGGSGG